MTKKIRSLYSVVYFNMIIAIIAITMMASCGNEQFDSGEEFMPDDEIGNADGTSNSVRPQTAQVNAYILVHTDSKSNDNGGVARKRATGGTPCYGDLADLSVRVTACPASDSGGTSCVTCESDIDVASGFAGCSLTAPVGLIQIDTTVLDMDGNPVECCDSGETDSIEMELDAGETAYIEMNLNCTIGDEDGHLNPSGCFLFSSYVTPKLDTPLPIRVGDTIRFHLEPSDNWQASESCNLAGWVAQLVGAQPDINGFMLQHSRPENAANRPVIVTGEFVAQETGEQMLVFNAAWLVNEQGQDQRLFYGDETTLTFPVRESDTVPDGDEDAEQDDDDEIIDPDGDLDDYLDGDVETIDGDDENFSDGDVDASLDGDADTVDGDDEFVDGDNGDNPDGDTEEFQPDPDFVYIKLEGVERVQCAGRELDQDVFGNWLLPIVQYPDNVITCSAIEPVQNRSSVEEAIIPPATVVIITEQGLLNYPSVDSNLIVNVDWNKQAASFVMLSTPLANANPTRASYLMERIKASPYLAAFADYLKNTPDPKEEQVAELGADVIADVLAHIPASPSKRSGSAGLDIDNVILEVIDHSLKIQHANGFSAENVCYIYRIANGEIPNQSVFDQALRFDHYSKDALVERRLLNAKSYFRYGQLGSLVVGALFDGLAASPDDLIQLEPGRVLDVQCYSGAWSIINTTERDQDFAFMNAESVAPYTFSNTTALEAHGEGRSINMTMLVVELIGVLVDITSFNPADIAQAINVATIEATTELGPMNTIDSKTVFLKYAGVVAYKTVGELLGNIADDGIANAIKLIAKLTGKTILSKIVAIQTAASAGIALDRAQALVLTADPMERDIVSVDLPVCSEVCGDKECGSDGCGGSCGSCSSNYTCNSSGQCQYVCQPLCSGKSCGSDGCGGSCGSCSSNYTCNSSGQCSISEIILDAPNANTSYGTFTRYPTPNGTNYWYKASDHDSFKTRGYNEDYAVTFNIGSTGTYYGIWKTISLTGNFEVWIWRPQPDSHDPNPYGNPDSYIQCSSVRYQINGQNYTASQVGNGWLRIASSVSVNNQPIEVKLADFPSPDSAPSSCAIGFDAIKFVSK